ncbi:MAG: hypothetical protein LBR71_07465 [Synergistaceae bacterium]|jgi:uncharacterized membrane protein YkvI|nr:hypothetical protein [Synergistaceae bacterium]
MGQKSNRNIQKNSFAWLSSGPLALAALMFSTYAGPGYASGTQTVAFFLTKGWIGVFWGPIVLGIATFIWCAVTFEFNRVYRPRDYREQSDMIYPNPIARRLFGIYTDFYALFQIVVVVAAMISGAAVLLQNMFGLPMMTGTVIFSVTCLALTMRGSKLVLSSATVLTLLILLVTLYIATVGLGPTWPLSMQFIAERHQPQEFNYSLTEAWWLILIFVANFTAGRNAAVPACLDSIKTRRDSYLAASFTAVFCAISTIIYTIIFSAGMPQIAKEPIPTLYVLDTMLKVSHNTRWIYMTIALAAMVSTGVALLYGGSVRFQKPLSKIWKNAAPNQMQVVLSLVILVGCTLLSKVGLIAIITKGYAYGGVICAPVLVYLYYITVPLRMCKDRANKVGPYAETKAR